MVVFLQNNVHKDESFSYVAWNISEWKQEWELEYFENVFNFFRIG